jgi:hypothetical protein
MPGTLGTYPLKVFLPESSYPTIEETGILLFSLLLRVAMHVATPTITGEKSRDGADETQGFECTKNSSEQSETSSATSRMRYPSANGTVPGRFSTGLGRLVSQHFPQNVATV